MCACYCNSILYVLVISLHAIHKKRFHFFKCLENKKIKLIDVFIDVFIDVLEFTVTL